MVRACCVPGCTSGVQVPSHKFPRSPSKFKLWLKALHLSENIILEKDKFRICHKHFAENAYIFTLNRKRLKHDAVPTLNLLMSEMSETTQIEINLQPSTSNCNLEFVPDIIALQFETQMQDMKVQKNMETQQIDKEKQDINMEVQEIDKEAQEIVKETSEIDMEVQEIDKQAQEIVKEVPEIDMEAQKIDKEVRKIEILEIDMEARERNEKAQEIDKKAHYIREITVRKQFIYYNLL
ncbi:uncharacterized protein LOC118648796 [Monomorium pharaonis]|uniref:uncharacterized protein LOC118648796 n=1 Tax=Monomorium pharaonis TaxID=307658 RepID=UPI0017476899|nr:uncharacterized protein LOC118648796 [Monomorium pharaonis]